MKVIVISPFRDKNNFEKKYEPGDDVSHFEQDRIDHVVKHGHAEIQEDDKADKKTKGKK